MYKMVQHKKWHDCDGNVEVANILGYNIYACMKICVQVFFCLYMFVNRNVSYGLFGERGPWSGLSLQLLSLC